MVRVELLLATFRALRERYSRSVHADGSPFCTSKDRIDASICWFVVRIFTNRCFSSTESRSLYTRNRFEYLACTSFQSAAESPSGLGPNVSSVAGTVCSATPRAVGRTVIATAVAASLAKCLRLSDSILFGNLCVSIDLHRRLSLTYFREIGRIARCAAVIRTDYVGKYVDAFVYNKED